MNLLAYLESLGIKPNASGIIDQEVLANNEDQLRELVNANIREDRRAEHYADLLGGVPRTGSADLALLERVEQSVFGDGVLTDAERDQVQPVFPLVVHVYVDTKPAVIDKPVDLSTPDGTIRRVAYTDLTLAQGGSVTAAATPLFFSCETLTRTGDTGDPTRRDFNILGRTGASPLPPAAPTPITQAGTGKHGECSSAGIAGPGGQPGNDGADGQDGDDGKRGDDGVASQLTAITITKTLTADRLTIFTRSGDGGKGADGAPGGQGQQGGNGGDGKSCGCTGNGGGPGKDGGRGGRGGRGGPGGNAADANGNVTVNVPTNADMDKVQGFPETAQPGKGGGGGPKGLGGLPGRGGSAGKDNRAGADGSSKGEGRAGEDGDSGTLRGRPAEIIPRVN